jgi:hypothetical protein
VFECTEPGQHWSVPRAPKSDIRLNQATEIQGMPAFCGSSGRDGVEVLAQQGTYFVAFQIVNADVERSHLGASRLNGATTKPFALNGNATAMAAVAGTSIP